MAPLTKRIARLPACLTLAMVLVSSASFAAPSKGASGQLRCGWWDNPTPGNVWFTDKDGEWSVAMQGMYESEGDGPEFKPSQQVNTNGPYGHGCTCMQVITDTPTQRITKIISARPLPLQQCRRDRALKEPR